MGSKEVEFHEAASLEYEAAFAWYFERSERAALRFAREVESAVASIAEAPERFPFGVQGTRRLEEPVLFLFGGADQEHDDQAGGGGDAEDA